MKNSVLIGVAASLSVFTHNVFADTAAAPAVAGAEEQAAVTVYGKLRLQYESLASPKDDRVNVGRASSG